MTSSEPTASQVLAEELGALLRRHGVSDGWCVVDVHRDGPLDARLVVVDAASQDSFVVAIEERPPQRERQASADSVRHRDSAARGDTGPPS